MTTEITPTLDTLTTTCTAFNSFEALSEAIAKGYTPTLRVQAWDADRRAVAQLRSALQAWGLPVYPPHV